MTYQVKCVIKKLIELTQPDFKLKLTQTNPSKYMAQWLKRCFYTAEISVRFTMYLN